MQFIIHLGTFIYTFVCYIGTVCSAPIDVFVSGLKGTPIGTITNPFNHHVYNVYNSIPLDWLGDWASALTSALNTIPQLIADTIVDYFPFMATAPFTFGVVLLGVLIIVPLAIWQAIVG